MQNAKRRISGVPLGRITTYSVESVSIALMGYPTSRGAVQNGLMCLGRRIDSPITALLCTDMEAMLDGIANATGMPRFVFPVGQRPGVNLHRWLVRAEAEACRRLMLRRVLAAQPTDFPW